MAVGPDRVDLHLAGRAARHQLRRRPRRGHLEDDDVGLHAGQVDGDARQLARCPRRARRALRVVLGEPVHHGARARTRPAAARTPDLPHAAAEHLAHAPRAHDEVARPHTTEPTGAPSPFDRQKVTESTGAREIGRRPRSSATAALKRRAPSRCTGTPRVVRDRGHRARSPRACSRCRRARLCVFSMAHEAGLGQVDVARAGSRSRTCSGREEAARRLDGPRLHAAETAAPRRPRS